MFSLTLENRNGDQLTFEQNSPFTVQEIQGLNPPDATINTSQVALMDGGKYNSAKVNMRQINVAFAIEYGAAYNRINVYKVLKSKQWVRLYYTGDYRNVYIDGYIQNIDISYFTMKQVVTCTILCPDPFFQQAQQMVNELSAIVDMFHFPFWSTDVSNGISYTYDDDEDNLYLTKLSSTYDENGTVTLQGNVSASSDGNGNVTLIGEQTTGDSPIVFGYIDTVAGETIENGGDIECGMIIELYARSEIGNPKIFDYITQEFFGLNYSMETGDLITIDTRQGKKTVTLLHNGVTTNIFNYVMKGSTWLQLDPHGSTFVYEVGSGLQANLSVTFMHYNLFEGV